jgi:multiple sugar transport system ATP-binding protein
MKDGEIVQVAEPLTLYNQPANTFVAGFIGSPPMNFFKGTIRADRDGMVFAENNSASAPLRLELDPRLTDLARQHHGRAVILGVRPEDIHDSGAPVFASRSDVLPAIVELAEPMGAETYLHCTTGAHPFIARVAPERRYKPGDRAPLRFALDRVHLFDEETGDRLVASPH